MAVESRMHMDWRIGVFKHILRFSWLIFLDKISRAYCDFHFLLGYVKFHLDTFLTHAFRYYNQIVLLIPEANKRFLSVKCKRPNRPSLTGRNVRLSAD